MTRQAAHKAEFQEAARDVTAGVSLWRRIADEIEQSIARGTYPVDIHNPNGRGTVLRSVPPGDAYDVPSLDRVEVACRRFAGRPRAGARLTTQEERRWE